MKMADMFEKVYCLNLARRPDRWAATKKMIPKGWPFGPVIRFNAIDGKFVPPPPWWTCGAGAWGCLRSHHRIIEQSLNAGIESIFLLEDDLLFPKDFIPRAKRFCENLPDDWGMVYFGGQHLYAHKHAPRKINEEVYLPFNINRTHAFGMRGDTMRAVYRHLSMDKWHVGNHVDHHLGRFVQKRLAKHRVYCPAEWLIGQGGGKSNISGRDPEDRMWASAKDIAAVDPKIQPFVAVLGLHSSGSSVIAGLLYHLGLHLGNNLRGHYGKDPGANCGYEAEGLAHLCEGCIPFPSTEIKVPRGRAWEVLGRWVDEKKREAHGLETIAAGKYPQLCGLGDQLLNICGDLLKVVNCVRPIEDSIKSLQRRNRKGKHAPEDMARHQWWLMKRKKGILKRLPPDRKHDMDFIKLTQDPKAEVKKLVKFLGIKPEPHQIRNAIDSVDPAKRHI